MSYTRADLKIQSVLNRLIGHTISYDTAVKELMKMVKQEALEARSATENQVPTEHLKTPDRGSGGNHD